MAEPTARTGPFDTFLSSLERLPAVTVEMDDARGSALVRVGRGPVAQVDLRHGLVLVRAPADRIAALRRIFPSSRPAPGGIVFDLTDARGRAEAHAAIRRRVIVERLIPQVRAASP